MKITLAGPVEGLGKPDDTVEVDDGYGRQLIRDGWARLPDTVPTAAADVEAVAAVEGVDLSGTTTVTEKRERIRAARNSKQEG